jgi:hypothetical protein
MPVSGSQGKDKTCLDAVLATFGPVDIGPTLPCMPYHRHHGPNTPSHLGP